MKTIEYRLISEYNKDEDILEHIFKNRGFKTKQDILHYINPTQDDLINPTLLDNMDAAAQLLIKHLQDKNKIVVIVDADCDGFTSSAILINYIFRTFPDFPPEQLEYFMHDGKQHGIEMDKIPLDMKLLIVPDASSNDNEQVRQLHELGVEVLILD